MTGHPNRPTSHTRHDTPDSHNPVKLRGIEPSDADRTATAAVKSAATVAGVRFLGHVVVAGEDWRVVNTSVG